MLSKKRTQYAYEVLVNKDMVKAEKIKNQLNLLLG